MCSSAQVRTSPIWGSITTASGIGRMVGPDLGMAARPSYGIPSIAQLAGGTAGAPVGTVVGTTAVKSTKIANFICPRRSPHSFLGLGSSSISPTPPQQRHTTIPTKPILQTPQQLSSSEPLSAVSVRQTSRDVKPIFKSCKPFKLSKSHKILLQSVSLPCRARPLPALLPVKSVDSIAKCGSPCRSTGDGALPDALTERVANKWKLCKHSLRSSLGRFAAHVKMLKTQMWQQDVIVEELQTESHEQNMQLQS